MIQAKSKHKMFYAQRYISLFLSCFTLCIISTQCLRDAPKYPVILVPGDGGSQFEARYKKPTVSHFWCSQNQKDWGAFWLNLELLVPYKIDCFADNMRLVYDPLTHTTTNSPGVETRVPGFGNTSTVEWLDSSHFPKTEYFYDIVDRLVTKLNYTRNINIRGAPYDFRKAPNEMGEYIGKVVKLVEETYYLNGNSRVVLLAHSMGNLYSLYILNHQPQQWKDKYIHSFISLAGPWGGALKVLRLMASGDNLGVFVVNPLSARVEQRSMPSSAWLLPYDSFWNDTEILVQGPNANYTVHDYERFFRDINYTIGYQMRKDTERLTNPLKAPGVDVHCVHGRDIDTPGRLIYTAKEWYNYQPNVINEDGDGTVNMRSLIGCLRWKSDTKHVVKHQVLSKAEHMTILHDKRTLDYIESALT